MGADTASHLSAALPYTAPSPSGRCSFGTVRPHHVILSDDHACTRKIYSDHPEESRNEAREVSKDAKESGVGSALVRSWEAHAMNAITAVAEMLAERDGMAGNVGLVPTMGYLHSFPVRAELVEASRPLRV